MERVIVATHRRSVEKLGEEMARTKPQGGNVPVLTGNLSRSVLASTDGMPRTSVDFTPGNNIGLVAATLQPEQTVWIGYQAIYAKRQNFGYVGADKLGRVYNQTGNYFVEAAHMKWPQIVEESLNEIQAAIT